MQSLGLYIHIPFCVQKCNYCDFLSGFGTQTDMERYTKALKTEMELWKEELGGQAVDTVFIGGGTPTFLPAAMLGEILEAARDTFHIREQAEITVEMNPGTIKKETLRRLAAAGMNRASIGLQSAQDTILKRLGRIHTFRQFLEGIEMLHQAGIANFNVDVMYGLPGQREEDYLQTLEAAVNTGAVHISAYSLIIEEGTPFYEWNEQGSLELPDEDITASMSDAGKEYLERRGLARYEVSNYAKKGYTCRHNLNYWKNGFYLGLGLGAHSCLGTGGKVWRLENTRKMDEYCTLLQRREKPYCVATEIEQKEQMFETIMLGLRMTHGINLAQFRVRFGVDFMERYGYNMKKAAEQGWIKAADGYVFLTSKGMDFMNRVLLDFME